MHKKVTTLDAGLKHFNAIPVEHQTDENIKTTLIHLKSPQQATEAVAELKKAGAYSEQLDNCVRITHYWLPIAQESVRREVQPWCWRGFSSMDAAGDRPQH